MDMNTVHKYSKQAYRSTEINELCAALAKAQGEMPAVYGEKINPFFQERFIDLGDMIAAARPSLSKYGLSVIQQILPNDEGQMMLNTLLCHSSGQWISSCMRLIPPQNDARSIDSYVTSLKRTAFSSMVGIVGAADDDDGEYAVTSTRDEIHKGTKLNTAYNPKENKLETITKEQKEELDYELSDYTDIAEMILDGLKIQHLADMPKSKFLTAINRIRTIKKIRNEGAD